MDASNIGGEFYDAYLLRSADLRRQAAAERLARRARAEGRVGEREHGHRGEGGRDDRRSRARFARAA